MPSSSSEIKVEYYMTGVNSGIYYVDDLSAKEQSALPKNIENELFVIIQTPQEFALNQNYPNPFNPETQIEFLLKENAHVKLEIFDIRGKKVKTISNGLKSAGYHTVVWNGMDDKDHRVSSGVYVYKIYISGKFGVFYDSKKMIFLK